MKKLNDPHDPGSLRTAGASGDLLLRLAANLCAAIDPEPAARFLVGELGQVISGRAWIVLWDSERREAAWSPPGDAGPLPLRLANSEGGLLFEALRNGRETVTPDPQRGADFPEHKYLAKSEGGAWAFLPMAAAGQSVGCVVLRAAHGERFDPERLAVIRGVLPALALFLRSGLLHRNLEARIDERTSEIALLYDVSQSLSLALQPEEVVSLICASVRKALRCQVVSFILLLPDQREMSVRLSARIDDRAVRKFNSLALAEAGRHLGEKPGRLSLTVAGPDDEPPASSDSMAILSVAHAPLLVRGRLLGLISAGSADASAFGEEQLRLIFTLANQAAVTLDRLRSAREGEIALLHSMLESMVEGVLLLDPEFRVVIGNPAAQSHLRVLLSGRVPARIKRLGDVELRDVFGEAPGSGARSRTFEVPLPAESKIFSITCSEVRQTVSGQGGMVVVISDVTEARTLQMQMAQSERLSALGEMISGVAHELNNPLASVIGNAQLLQDKDVDDEIRKKLQAIDTEATRCRKIVQNLLRFARRHVPERRPLDVNKALDSVLTLLGRQLEVDGIIVKMELQQDLDLVVGDFHLLLQVFMNIVFNAFQAMKEKGGPGLLSVRTRCRDGRVIVDITDNGPGIPPQVLKRIFDPFFSTKEVGKGTGLGLSLAYGTVKEHNGAITARSKVGHGTTFVIELPVASEIDLASQPAPHEISANESAQDGKSEGSARRHETPVITGRKILVVEDESALAEVMLEVLRTRGHEVDIAPDGRTARARVAENQYDLIISDMKMPNMSGRELYRQIVASDPQLARKIIFSTGDTANPETQAFFEEVRSPFLSKPFSLVEMLDLVDSVLRQD